MRRPLTLLLAAGLALAGSACADDETPAALGQACDKGADRPCVAGAVCVAVTDDQGQSVDQCRTPFGGTCDGADPYCGPDLVCEERAGGDHGCYSPVVLEGMVVDASDGGAIEGAHVLALNEESVAVTDVAVSDAEGRYSLAVPAARDADGAPVDATYTLRASAQGYQTFPGGVRNALPIATSESADEGGERWVISGTLTEVVLIPLQGGASGLGTISGAVVPDDGYGVLVVAEGGGQAISAVSDRDGEYTIFNVPSGSYTVSGYKAGLSLTAATASVAGDDVEGVDLDLSSAPLTTLSGNVQIVNAPGGAVTSVVLVVESTFSDTFGRGEVPPGLRAPATGPVSVDGDWTIAGVPDGRYVVLAAFENDELVRDPDTNISGTDYVTLELPHADGTDVTLSDSFKVTEALAVIRPGAEVPEAVTAGGALTLEWARDSGIDWYTVDVYDAYGDLVWSQGDIPKDAPSATYGGPLEAGMYYQFRATSWRKPASKPAAPASRTEDLLGVFYVPAP